MQDMTKSMHDYDENWDDAGPSKSQLKREATALQALGKRLVDLESAQLEKIALPEDLHAAVIAARGMNRRGARKRQLQYIGKLMRHVDAAPIQAALKVIDAGGIAAKRQQHQLENLCAALVAGDEAGLAGLLERHPEANRQHLRQLICNAVREAERGKPPKSRRALFRYVRALEQDGS
jgi:ribosome-associated protein